MRQQVFNGAQEPSNRMTLGRRAQVLSCDVQIDLRARDQPMAEQVADRDEPDAFAHEVRGKGVSQPMRTHRLGEPGATRERAHALIYSPATDRLAEARAEEGRRRQRGSGVDTRGFGLDFARPGS